MSIRPLPPKTAPLAPAKSQPAKAPVTDTDSPAVALTRKAQLQQLRAHMKPLLAALAKADDEAEKQRLRQRILREILRLQLPQAVAQFPDIGSVIADIDQHMITDEKLRQRFERFLKKA